MSTACKNIETPTINLGLPKEDTSYTLFSPGDEPDTIENYLLLSIDGIGFLVIKHTLDLKEL